MLALSLTGLARVAAGEIAEGMRELDQATAAAVAGELSGLHFAGAVCCHMIYACERVHDVERAAQWCETVRGFTEQWSVPQLFGFCRSHYASVLIWRGRVDRRRGRARGRLPGVRARRARAGLRGHPAPGGAAPPAGPPGGGGRAVRAHRVASRRAALPRRDRPRPRRRAGRARSGRPPPARAAARRAPRPRARARAGRPRASGAGGRPRRRGRRRRAARARRRRRHRAAARIAAVLARTARPRARRRGDRPARSSRTRSTCGAGCARPTSSPAAASRSPSWRPGRREPTTTRGGFEPPDEGDPDAKQEAAPVRGRFDRGARCAPWTATVPARLLRAHGSMQPLPDDVWPAKRGARRAISAGPDAHLNPGRCHAVLPRRPAQAATANSCA